jgi:16S rRNA C1402 N4-methylase RsmH
LANIFTISARSVFRRIAHAIVTDRAKNPFTPTTMLASMVPRGARQTGEVHPATRVFQKRCASRQR